MIVYYLMLLVVESNAMYLQMESLSSCEKRHAIKFDQFTTFSYSAGQYMNVIFQKNKNHYNPENPVSPFTHPGLSLA